MLYQCHRAVSCVAVLTWSGAPSTTLSLERKGSPTRHADDEDENDDDALGRKRRRRAESPSASPPRAVVNQFQQMQDWRNVGYFIIYALYA